MVKTGVSYSDFLAFHLTIQNIDKHTQFKTKLQRLNGHVLYIFSDKKYSDELHVNYSILILLRSQNSALHELGHALGLLHENMHPESTQYFRLSYKEVSDSKDFPSLQKFKPSR